METTNTARNFALQLGSLIALYVSLSALVAVIFGAINTMYPDQAEGYWAYDSAQQGIRFGIAMLIVFFPTYIVLTRFVNQIRRKETGTYLVLTKWLVYLSLLVGGAILLGDLVAVILMYLNGEITTRFIFKAAALLVVVGAAFYYYIQDARGYWNTHEKESKLYAAGAGAAVIAVLVLGFFNSDTPKEAREMRLDQQQIDSLSDMEWRISDHFQINKSLPSDIETLYVGIEAPKAPEDRKSYEYKIIDEDTYELCATFAKPSMQNGNNIARPAMSATEALKNPYNNWDHGEGRTCFERTVIDYSKPQAQ
jgi:hypothetical protein